MLQKDHLLVANEQAWPDMAHCDRLSSTLLYFSSCKTLTGLCAYCDIQILSEIGISPRIIYE